MKMKTLILNILLTITICIWEIYQTGGRYLQFDGVLRGIHLTLQTESQFYFISI